MNEIRLAIYKMLTEQGYNVYYSAAPLDAVLPYTVFRFITVKPNQVQYARNTIVCEVTHYTSPDDNGLTDGDVFQSEIFRIWDSKFYDTTNPIEIPNITIRNSSFDFITPAQFTQIDENTLSYATQAQFTFETNNINTLASVRISGI